ncbi:acyl-CoA dehydrogenase family protein [Algoriphagus namhaensis]
MQIFTAELAAKAEKIGKLPDSWLDEIHSQKLFKLFVPVELGGLGLSFPEALKVEENLAKKDGSLGWTVTLCAGAGWFVGFLEASMAEETFGTKRVCLAGSGYVGGIAERTADGYLIEGSWTYASGALHATHFTANCEIWENGQSLRSAAGDPLIVAFILKKEEVIIREGWSYMGMRATGSYSFDAPKQKVPLNRAFEIKPDRVIRQEAIYKFPFLQFAECTLAVNILGITEHFQELIRSYFYSRNAKKAWSPMQLEHFENCFDQENGALLELREDFYAKCAEAWVQLQAQSLIHPQLLQGLSESSRELTHFCRISNARLYPFAGLAGADQGTELNRVWRDFLTVSQHGLLIFPFA